MKIILALVLMVGAVKADTWVSIVCDPVEVRSTTNEQLTIEFKEKQTCPAMYSNMEMLSIVYTHNQFRTFSFILTSFKKLADQDGYAQGVFGVELEAYDYTATELNMKSRKVYTICREYLDDMNTSECFNRN